MRIACERLRFARGGNQIFADTSLTIDGPGITLITGANGSGKSSLLRLIAGLEQPQLGRIVIDGIAASARTRSHIAFAFQEPVFLSGSVRANLDLALRLRGLAKKERCHRIAASAERLGIADILERPARAISGGEAHAVNLARALCAQAAVTLLDEPLSGFDQDRRAQLFADLPGLLRADASATVLVSHDEELIAALAPIAHARIALPLR
jgi:ABC-type sugar transport system ATPase subunit